MNLKKTFIFAGIIFLFSISFINFASAVEGCSGDADCLSGETCNQNSFQCQDVALVGSWTFDDRTAGDASSNRNDGILQNGASIVTDLKRGQVLGLDGINDYVYIPDSESLRTGDIDFTVAGWVYFNSFPTLHTGLIAKWTGEYALYREGERFLFTVQDQGAANQGIVYSTIPIAIGDWYFVVAEHDAANNRIGISINGGAMNYAPWTYGVGVGTAPLKIGADQTTVNYLDGKIDDVRIYKKVLSAAEIQKLAGVTPLPPPPLEPETGKVGHWKFDEDFGTTAFDTSGENNPGVLLPSGSEPTWVTPGKVGNAALNFDGINDYVYIPDSESLRTGDIDFTVAGWVYFNSFPTLHTGLITKWTGEYALYREGNRFLFTVQDQGAANQGIVYSTIPIVIGSWYFVVAEHDAANNRIGISINGGAMNYAPWTYGVGVGTAPLKIGVDQTTVNYLDGGIDDVRVYKRVLSAAEIQKLFIGTPVLPEGISGVTGTVTVTGGVALGNPITITGGAAGGDVNVVNSANVLTANIDVPANTETSLSINSAGEPEILSTTATLAFPLIILNPKATSLNVYLKPPRNEALLIMMAGHRIEVYQKDPQTIGFKSSSTNSQSEGVQFSILGRPSSSSDCDSVTCASLGGTCNGNWCLPNAEIGKAFSTGGISINGGLSSGRDAEFKSSQTASGHDVLELSTLSGLLAEIKGKGVALARLNMFPSGKADVFLDRDIAAVAPNSQGIGIEIFPSPGNAYYGIKVRKLDKGNIYVARPVGYKLDLNGDKVSDMEYGSKVQNDLFNKVTGGTGGYITLSPTRANGINMMVLGPIVELAPQLEVIHNGVSQTKALAQEGATAFNFIQATGKDGNPVTVAGNSRTVTGSLIEEISPAAIIEGWNYWYAATDDNYWNWNVVLESLPSGCVADKTSASAIVANGVQTLAFNVNCGTTASTTGAVVSGMAIEGLRGFGTKGKAQLFSEFSDCTEVLKNGQHLCQPSQKFKDEAAQVVKGVMNPTLTGSAVSGLGETESSILIVISLLTLAGIIALITLQVRRKSVDW